MTRETLSEGRQLPLKKRWRKYGAVYRKVFTVIALFALTLISSAYADRWVTRKNPKRGHKLLGRVVLIVEVRADGTVKRAWPSAANLRPAAAWRAARAARDLTFRPGAERELQLPVTVYLD